MMFGDNELERIEYEEITIRIIEDNGIYRLVVVMYGNSMLRRMIIDKRDLLSTTEIKQRLIDYSYKDIIIAMATTELYGREWMVSEILDRLLLRDFHLDSVAKHNRVIEDMVHRITKKSTCKICNVRTIKKGGDI